MQAVYLNDIARFFCLQAFCAGFSFGCLFKFFGFSAADV
jgi:hypothetical protein